MKKIISLLIAILIFIPLTACNSNVEISIDTFEESKQSVQIDYEQNIDDFENKYKNLNIEKILENPVDFLNDIPEGFVFKSDDAYVPSDIWTQDDYMLHRGYDEQYSFYRRNGRILNTEIVIRLKVCYSDGLNLTVAGFDLPINEDTRSLYNALNEIIDQRRDPKIELSINEENGIITLGESF